MKTLNRILLIIFAIIFLNSCTSTPEEVEYTVVYKVYFSPEEVRTYTETRTGDETGGIHLCSYKGSNHLIFTKSSKLLKDHSEHPIISTTAPIEIISSTSTPNTKQK